MGQPQAYDRARDFTEQSGDETDHAGLNAELDALALTIGQIRERLALIQRDDGAVKVGPELLADIAVQLDAAIAQAEAHASAALGSAFSASTSKDQAGVFSASAQAAKTGAQLSASQAATSLANLVSEANLARADFVAALAQMAAHLATSKLPAVLTAGAWLKAKEDGSGYEFKASAAIPTFYGLKLSADGTELLLDYGRDNYNVADFKQSFIAENISISIQDNSLVIAL